MGHKVFDTTIELSSGGVEADSDFIDLLRKYDFIQWKERCLFSGWFRNNLELEGGAREMCSSKR